jgi:hypothetical protein
MSYILQDSYNFIGGGITRTIPTTVIGKTYTKSAQKFLATSSYSLKRAGLRIGADSYPKTVTINLYDSSFSVLATKSVVISEQDWAYVDFDSAVAISSGTTYALGVDAPLSGNLILPIYNSTDGDYDNGNSWIWNSTDSIWVETPAVQDMPFRTYSQYVFSPPTPSGLNAMKTIKRLVCAAANKVWYES